MKLHGVPIPITALPTLALASTAAAEHVVQVNSYTSGRQHSATAVCEPDGGYLVTWQNGTAPNATTHRRRQKNSYLYGLYYRFESWPMMAHICYSPSTL